MAIVNDLTKIRDWLQTEVCDKVQFKLPNEDKADASYPYELVKPTAFVLFTPTKDRLPPNVRAPIPSVCIRLVEGEHRPTESTNRMSLMLNFCTWNPGIHARDNFVPIEEGAGMKGYNQVAEGEYKRSVDGWQDVYNFIDVALRAIERAQYIADMRVVSEDGIKYGMTSDANGLDDFYPFWPAWISFTVQAGNVRAKSFDDLL